VAAQLVETQEEMLRMLARLQKQHVKLADSIDLIQKRMGLPTAPDTPLSNPRNGAAGSDSSEDDFTTFGL
jgi:hypothetical protein